MIENTKLLLAIDVGTTNWKVAAFDTDGKAVCIEKMPAATHYDEQNHSYYKPHEIWGGISALIKTVVHKCDGDIIGVSATSMAEAVVPIDGAGDECFDIITWFDTRSIMEAEYIVSAIGKDKLYRITGLDPNPIFSLCKMLWVRNHYPEVYDRSVKWLQMTDYILYKLTGVMATDYTLASRTLAFDILKNTWSDEILDTLHMDKSLFPDVTESGTVIGSVSPGVSRATGLAINTPVVMGGNDHPCAALPAGVLNGRKVLDSSGTAESIILISQRNKTPEMTFCGQRTCRFLDSTRYALWGGIISSGASFEWIYRTLTSVEEWGFDQSYYGYQDVLSQLDDVPPGSNGLLFIPHLRGSGAPNWNPRMKGSFLGLTSTTTQKEMLKAVMEGLSFQARMIVDMHRELSREDIEALCVVGGSGKNAVWQQIKADVLQLPVEICEESDATALGAAMLAGIGAGVYQDMIDATKKVAVGNTIIMPNVHKKSVYDRLYQIYKDACDMTVDVSERLHDFNRDIGE